MKATVLTALVFVFSVAAAVVSYKLTLTHVSGTADQGWLEWGCSSSREPGAANCAAVLASPYACFPPRESGKAGGCIPVALLGLFYYATIAIWSLGVGIPSRSRAWLHVVPTLLVFVGLAGSAYFAWVMFTKLDQWCPWCALTHVLNLLIAICIFLMWPVARRLAPTRQMGSGGTVDQSLAGMAAAGQVSHSDAAGAAQPVVVPRGVPSARVVVMTVLAVVGVNFAAFKVFHEMTWRTAAFVQKSNYDRCSAFITTLKKSPAALFALWQSYPQVNIPRGSDDPVKTYDGEGQALDVVVFSDFECPGCKGFATLFESSFVPLFSVPVQLRFKHYPIDGSCNPQTTASTHPHACQAAKLAEAARALGGNEAFWKAHDYLFAQRDTLAAGSLSVQQFAQALGLEQQRVIDAMNSPEVLQRIVDDARLAGSVGVSSTPAVYVEGKYVDQVAKGEIGFWTALAESRRGAHSRANPPEGSASKASPN